VSAYADAVQKLNAVAGSYESKAYHDAWNLCDAARKDCIRAKNSLDTHGKDHGCY